MSKEVLISGVSPMSYARIFLSVQGGLIRTQELISLFCFLLSLAVEASGVPYLPSGECSKKIDYTYYTICYEADFRQASWVKYELTLKQITGKQKRVNNFRKDSNVEDPVESTDYKGSGYDRGHLVPAGDMKFSYQSMSETFYMTNMSPQEARFNQGIWVRMEDYARNLVRDNGDAHVISAPVLVKGLPRIKSGISVPDWYYKIIYIPSKNIMISFLIENKDHGKADIRNYQVTVDEIEELTGFDFFSEMADGLENSLESKTMSL